MSLTRVGGDLLKQPLNIGTGVTITPDGNATFSGIVTAANLVGSDGKPIASGAGLGTAVVAGSDEGGEQIYYTNTVLNITDNLTIDPPDSANASYTQYQEVAVEQGKDLIVEDDFIVDVLGISSSVATPLPGQGGRVRADRFTNKAGTGAPTFPNGIEVTTDATVGGALTVTSNLTVDGNLVVNGSETSLKTTKLQVDDINIGIAPFDNKLSDGQLNGAGFTIHGLNGDKSLTWDNPNDRMAFSTDLYAPRMYADSITVGDTFLKVNQVGLGQTTTTGRNAGVSTATGTLIFNNTTNSVEIYDGIGWKSVSQDGQFIQATGGAENIFSEGGVSYKSHTFTSSGTFSVNYVGPPAYSAVDYLVVGGGGGAAGDIGGGGGAGGFRVGSGHTVTTGDYTITVGSGGAASATGPTVASNGGNSIFDTVTSLGGGGGSQGVVPASDGGSGGGCRGSAVDEGNGTAGQGNPGGDSQGPATAGGGGGAARAGYRGSDNTNKSGNGGDGLVSTITGSSVTYAGGGGGGGYPAGPAAAGTGGAGGGGNGSSGIYGAIGDHASANTGGGGGGSGVSVYPGGTGGSGIVVVRYQVGNVAVKATGGVVSYANGKTIHTFKSSGHFTVNDSSLSSVEYLVVAGGGGGAFRASVRGGGGGGAGGFRTGGGFPVSVQTYSVTVGGGGVGTRYNQPDTDGTPGQNSVFSTITSAGGGGGGAGGGDAPDGGSGGGGSSGGTNTAGSGNTPPVSPPQGNAGGTGGSNPNPNRFLGGGGGGAGGAGFAGNLTLPEAGGQGGQGGIGSLSSITGQQQYFAGGGGGGCANAGGQAERGGDGGLGGGGAAAQAGQNNPGSPGTVNTGGGGGGSGGVVSAGSGGSGIVIISYPT